MTFELLGVLFIIVATAALFKINQSDSLSKRRLAAIEAAGDGIGIVDAAGNLTYINRALMDLHCIERSSDHIGRPWVDLYTEKGKIQIETIVMPFLQQNGFWRGESPIVTNTGQVITADLSLTRLPDGGFIGTARDVSRRKKDEIERDVLQRKLIQAQKMETVGGLTGGIAHDFNNTLTIISGNLEVLEEHIGPVSHVRKNLLSARRAVTRGAELTQRLLAFSRQQILAPKIVNINHIIPETFEMMKRMLGGRVEIILSLDPHLWNTKLDTGQIENALLNLCVNARDAMPEGGSITIRTENVAIESGDLRDLSYVIAGDYVKIMVADSGHGIPASIIDRVFDPFFTTKDVGAGSGLGLSMVYGFTKQSGGYVFIDSLAGKGTTVTLYFPRQAEGELSDKKPEKKLAAVQTHTAAQTTILVVEDEVEVLEYNKGMLVNAGYKVRAARNGAEAVLILDELDELDLLITDVIMPGGISGIEVAEEARSAFSQVRILFVSGYASESLHGISHEKHIEFLEKPYTRAVILEKVNLLLNLKGD